MEKHFDNTTSLTECCNNTSTIEHLRVNDAIHNMTSLTMQHRKRNDATTLRQRNITCLLKQHFGNTTSLEECSKMLTCGMLLQYFRNIATTKSAFNVKYLELTHTHRRRVERAENTPVPPTKLGGGGGGGGARKRAMGSLIYGIAKCSIR